MLYFPYVVKECTLIFNDEPLEYRWQSQMKTGTCTFSLSGAAVETYS